MGVNLFLESWERSATGRLTRELRLSRVHFGRHPLYMHWTREAFQQRSASWADAIPDQLMSTLPTLLVISPFAALFIIAILGTDAFNLIFAIFMVIMLLLAVAIGMLGTIISASVAAMSLAGEQRSGRWDIVMMMPDKRTSVMVMRVASMIYPYRTLMGTIEILQTCFALIVALYLSGEVSDADSGLLGTCIVAVIPSLFILTWERRQDFALGIALGAFSGLFRQEQNTQTAVVGGSLLLLIARAIVGILAIGLAPNAHGFWLILPVFIGGPALLPLMGIALLYALPLMLLYYGGREIIISRLWRKSLNSVWG